MVLKWIRNVVTTLLEQTVILMEKLYNEPLAASVILQKQCSNGRHNPFLCGDNFPVALRYIFFDHWNAVLLKIFYKLLLNKQGFFILMGNIIPLLYSIQSSNNNWQCFDYFKFLENLIIFGNYSNLSVYTKKKLC